MNQENRKIVLEAARLAGDFLKGKLAPIDGHPVRNSYAHVYHAIKEKFGKSYKDCDDDQVQSMLTFIDDVKNIDEGSGL
jgi:hypothetical protein